MMVRYLQAFFGLCLLFGLSASISDSCISCIGKVEGGGRGCNWDVNSNSCGKYQIKLPYWIDCYRPGSTWQACAGDDNCAKKCIRAYMSRYAKLCANDLHKSIGDLTCQDFGRLHNGGPRGCSNSNTDIYVRMMNQKC